MTWADGASIRTGTVTHPEMKSCIRGEGWGHRTSEVFVARGDFNLTILANRISLLFENTYIKCIPK